MTTVINTHYRFVYVAIPKVASTTMWNALKGLKGNLEHKELNRHLPMADIERMFPMAKRFFAFGLHRSPESRIGSMYRHVRERHPRECPGFNRFVVDMTNPASWVSAQVEGMRKPQWRYVNASRHVLTADISKMDAHLENVGAVLSELGCPGFYDHVAGRIGHENKGDKRFAASSFTRESWRAFVSMYGDDMIFSEKPREDWRNGETHQEAAQ